MIISGIATKTAKSILTVELPYTCAITKSMKKPITPKKIKKPFNGETFTGSEGLDGDVDPNCLLVLPTSGLFDLFSALIAKPKL